MSAVVCIVRPFARPQSKTVAEWKQQRFRCRFPAGFCAGARFNHIPRPERPAIKTTQACRNIGGLALQELITHNSTRDRQIGSQPMVRTADFQKIALLDEVCLVK